MPEIKRSRNRLEGESSRGFVSSTGLLFWLLT
jgi:hypothetical protein